MRFTHELVVFSYRGGGRSADPRFHVHGLAIRQPEGRVALRTDTAAALEQLQADYGRDLEKVIVVCHNALFDLYVLNHIYGVRPARFIDTLQLAHHVHGRREGAAGQDASLEALARHYGLPAKGALQFMLGVRSPDPRQLQQLTEYAIHDVELTWQLALRLLPHISRPDMELAIAMHTIRLFTQRRLRVDLDLLEQIIADTQKQVNDSIARAGVGADVIVSNKRFSLGAGLREYSHRGQIKVKRGLCDKGHDAICRKFSINNGLQHLIWKNWNLQCPGQESNLQGFLSPPAPQAGASANFATRAGWLGSVQYRRAGGLVERGREGLIDWGGLGS